MGSVAVPITKRRPRQLEYQHVHPLALQFLRVARILAALHTLQSVAARVGATDLPIAAPATSGSQMPHAQATASCMAAAETEIERAPEKDDMHVTTSKRFKRDLAQFFCELPHSQIYANATSSIDDSCGGPSASAVSSRLTALELGTFRGHTTAVLAAIFGRVLAADVEAQYLRAAAAHCSGSPNGASNIAFITLDSFADDWKVLSSNGIHVVFIDGDHRYGRVRQDAHKALGLLEPVNFVVFDDYGVELGVRQTVEELVQTRALRDCQPMGLGSDGAPWLLKNWDWVNHSEGMLCRRGSGMPAAATTADFVDKSFLLYAVPTDHLMRAHAVWAFWSSGVLWTSLWGRGTWTVVQKDKRARKPGGVLNVTLASLQPGAWEVLFNRPRTAFLLTMAGDPQSRTRWFGLLADRVNHVFEVANEQFDV